MPSLATWPVRRLFGKPVDRLVGKPVDWLDRLVFPFQAQAAKFEKDPYSRSSLISLSNVGQQEKFQHFVQKSMFYEVIFIYLLSPISLQKFL